METTALRRIFKLSALASLALAAAMLAQPIYADSIRAFTLTESSTGLTLTAFTANGNTIPAGTVTPTAVPDSWTVTLPTGFFWHSSASWSEPVGTQWNDVSAAVNTSTATVTSDALASLVSSPTFNNGMDYSAAIFDTSGQDYPLTFVDNGDAPVSSVPDSGSTLVLSVLALVAFFGANRFRSFRVA